MKRLVVFMMLVAGIVTAQPVDEAPEPVWSNDEYSYECQIAWGSKTGLAWEPVPVVSTQILPQTLDDHFYGIVVIGTDRRTWWMGKTPMSTASNPEVIKISISMPALPNGKWWGFYRVRFRPFPLGDPAGEGWSETSRWAMIIDLSALPGIGPFVGLTGE